MTPETAQLVDPREDVTSAFGGSWHATPNNVGRACRALLASLRDEEPSERVLDAIGQAVTEAATNSVYHAYVARRVGQFRITATIDADEIHVTVEDDGAGFDDEGVVGRGLSRIASAATRVQRTSRPGSGTVTAMWFDRA